MKLSDLYEVYKDKTTHGLMVFTDNINNSDLFPYVNLFRAEPTDAYFPLIKGFEEEFFTGEFADRTVYSKYEMEVGTTKGVQAYEHLWNFLFWKNKDKYKHLYELTQLEYDPIANYDRKEFTETTYSDEHSTYIKGTDTLTDVYGTETNTEVNGERDSSMTYGNTSIDSIRDTTKGTSVDNINAFDSNMSVEVASNTYTMTGSADGDKMKDTTTQAEHTDTEHTDEFTNTTTKSEHTDTHTQSGHTDEETKDTHTTTVESIVSGNVGVTQTVAMMESEQAFWSNYSFIYTVYSDFINELCLLVY